MFVHLIASGASNPMEMDLNRDPLKGCHSSNMHTWSGQGKTSQNKRGAKHETCWGLDVGKTCCTTWEWILEGTPAMVATRPRQVLLGAQPQGSHLEGGRIEGTEVKRQMMIEVRRNRKKLLLKEGRTGSECMAS